MHIFEGVSGSASDRRHALLQVVENAEDDPVDVIIGDWMSEANMTTSSARLQESEIARILSYII